MVGLEECERATLTWPPDILQRRRSPSPRSRQNYRRDGLLRISLLFDNCYRSLRAAQFQMFVSKFTFWLFNILIESISKWNNRKAFVGRKNYFQHFVLLIGNAFAWHRIKICNTKLDNVSCELFDPFLHFGKLYIELMNNLRGCSEFKVYSSFTSQLLADPILIPRQWVVRLHLLDSWSPLPGSEIRLNSLAQTHRWGSLQYTHVCLLRELESLRSWAWGAEWSAVCVTCYVI